MIYWLRILALALDTSVFRIKFFYGHVFLCLSSLIYEIGYEIYIGLCMYVISHILNASNFPPPPFLICLTVFHKVILCHVLMIF